MRHSRSLVLALVAFILAALLPSASSALSEPVAVLEVLPAAQRVGGAFTFRGALSYSPEGTVVAYDFSFGDGNSTGWVGTHTVQYTYERPGSYTVKLRVRDDEGGVSKETERTVAVLPPNRAPTAVIAIDSREFPRGAEVRVDLTGSSDPEGDTLLYYVDFGDGIDSGWTYNPILFHTYSIAGEYNISARVKDMEGAESAPAQMKVRIVEAGLLSKDLVLLIFIFVGLVIMVGFVGNFIFKKYGVPDVLSLLVLGLIVGPVFQLVDVALLSRFALFFGGLALMILLFDGGLNLPLRKVVGEAPRAAALGFLGFLFTMGTVGIFTGLFLFDGRWSYGLLLGAIIGGTSGAIVLPLVQKLDVSDEIKTDLSIESALTDVLCVVAVIAIIQVIVPSSGAGMGPSEIARSVLSAFTIGAFIGGILGVLWVWVLRKIERAEYGFMLTIAAVFIVYSLTEWSQGSGPVATLIFGLVLSNGEPIGRLLQMREAATVTTAMKQFHSEISFFIRSFFFVYIGMIISIKDFWTVLWGLLIVGVAVAARYAAVKLALFRSTFSDRSDLFTVLMPRGLAAAVLAMMPLQYGVEKGVVFKELAFVVIIVTVIITTVGVPLTQRRRAAAPAAPAWSSPAPPGPAPEPSPPTAVPELQALPPPEAPEPSSISGQEPPVYGEPAPAQPVDWGQPPRSPPPAQPIQTAGGPGPQSPPAPQQPGTAAQPPPARAPAPPGRPGPHAPQAPIARPGERGGS
ncbi:MAG: cation:proton antiporter [Thermoplasmata archaeon]